MKKLLLFASALTGFAMVAQAQEATTVKTTTVQYQAPTCTNCRTTTEVRTVYPEPEPVCNTCAEPVVAQPVVVKREKKTVCKSNHELGIRNPLFVMKEGEVSLQTAYSTYQEPKRAVRPAQYDPVTGEKNKQIAWRGWDGHSRVDYAFTDKWSVRLHGGKQYHTPKTNQYVAARGRPIPHQSNYDVTLGTHYHILDLCHLDIIAGVEATWHRYKEKKGERVKRITGVSWDPTVTIGSTWGWFTPYFEGSYVWDHTRDKESDKDVKKSWIRSHGYHIRPGIYIQPSKWYAFDFSWEKMELSKEKPEWHAGIDFYPYKNFTVGVEFDARRPYADPMDMYGIAVDAKIVF